MAGRRAVLAGFGEESAVYVCASILRVHGYTVSLSAAAAAAHRSPSYSPSLALFVAGVRSLAFVAGDEVGDR